MSKPVLRWQPYGWSIALHVALLGIVVLAAYRSEPAAPRLEALAIEAVVVDVKDLGAPPASAPQAAAESVAPPLPEPEPAPEPAPEPEPDVRDLLREQAEQAKAAERQRQTELAAKRKAEADAKRKAEAEAEAKRKADAEAKRKAEAEAKRKAAAEAEAKRKAEAEAETRRVADERRIKAEREADLRREIEAEEGRRNAARLAGLGAQWAQAIQARVQRAWIRPPSARAGLDCVVLVTQVPGGTVVRAEVKSCNGDDAVRQSIEAAVFRASPLPPPPDPALFERVLELRFRPND
jgi:colicin import membrane protein